MSAFAWLIRDTFLRARSSGFNLVLFAVSLLATVATFIGATPDTTRTWLFNLSFGVADVAGVFLVLIATAAFLPTFLEPAHATVLVAKPLGRTRLLLGKVTGVVLFVALHAGIFVVGTFVAAGLKTGVWIPAYLLAWPLLLIQFVAFYGASALIAVASRSTAACMLASTLLWAVSWGLSFGKHFLTAVQLEEATPPMGRAVGFGYWVLPKPTDFSLILHQAMGIAPEGLTGTGLQKVIEQELFNPVLAVISSLAFGLVMLGLAAYEWSQQDY